jgi:hypothetical protein
VPVLLDDAVSDNAALRSGAMNTLRQLAEPGDVARLLQALLRTEKGREREEAEKTIVAVCDKVPEAEQRAALVINAPGLNWSAAGSNAELAIVLPVLGRLGGSKAQQVVQDALGSPQSEIHQAAVQALVNWPTPTVSPDLLKLAEGAADAKERQLALRGLIRVNSLTPTLPGDKSNAPRLGMLKKAMELATGDEERNLVLDGLALIKDIETLRYVLPFLEHKALGQRACRTVVELAHSKTLREPNRAEFQRALDQVLTLCRDKGLLERAKKYKEGG